MRDLTVFHIIDDQSKDHVLISDIHNEQGYRAVRSALAKQYDLSTQEPDIQVIDADLKGDRELHLKHTIYNDVLLDEKWRNAVLRHIAVLWGYGVSLHGCDNQSGKELYLAQSERD